jgi:hypothetical protein
MQTQPLPPLELLNELLIYCPDTGILKWRKRNQGTRGESAGYRKNTGYIALRSVKWGGGEILAHRIAWALHHQTLPDVREIVDHLNGVKDDNRISNLCLTSQSRNCSNRALRSDNKSGHRGVFWCNTWRRWMVWINVDKKRIYVGRFQNLDDAINARLKAEADNNIYIREAS